MRRILKEVSGTRKSLEIAELDLVWLGSNKVSLDELLTIIFGYFSYLGAAIVLPIGYFVDDT